MRYWWASHGRNYETAIKEGTLWGCPSADGVLTRGLTALKDMRQGDVVFHYFGPYVRAVSLVAKEWHDYPRPDGYEAMVGQGNDGWLVRVDTIATGLRVHRDRVAKLTSPGTQGPFTAAGRPERRYLSPLADDEGAALLAAAGLSVPEAEAGSLHGLPGHVWGSGEPDTQGFSDLRLEQEFLRRNILGERRSAPCSICGEELSARLLSAALIKPRSHSDDQERMDFIANAMLTCSLGCKTLHEWGYVVVDGCGFIRPGRAAETRRVQVAVDALVGRHCKAHDDRTAANFAEAARLVLG